MEQRDKPTPLLPDTAPADGSRESDDQRSRLRQQHLIKITRRLVTLTGGSLLLVGAFSYLYTASRTFLVLYVFIGGLLGGFVSIQQRLPNIDLEELKELSQSWVSIVMIPINGGIFAVVLHLMFLGKILQGSLFPQYFHPEFDTDSILESFSTWMSDAFPADGPSLAKLFFWSFVAGFSERLVPQIIRKTAAKVDSKKGS